MTIAELRSTLDPVGRELYDCVADLHEVPSGTPVFDWTVPNEWNIRDAYVKNARGERVIDYRDIGDDEMAMLCAPVP